MRLTRPKWLTVLFLLTICGLVPVSVANAAPVLDGTFTPTGQPGQMTYGPDGNVWFALSGSSANKEIARIEADGTITEYDTPNDQAVIDLAPGPSVPGGEFDRIWMSQNGSVVKWDPAAGSGEAIAVAALAGPRGVVADEGGFIWLVDDGEGLIRLDPGDGSVTDEIPVAGSGGRGITLGSDGNLWWADFGQGAINRTSATSPFATTSFPTGGNPQETVAGPEGQIGFGDPGTFPQTVGVIDEAGTIKTGEAANSDPFGITFASDGAYWTANFASSDLGRLTTDGEYTVGLAMPAASGPRYLTAGAPGTIWVSLETSKEIARVTGVPIPEPPDPPDPPDPPGPPDPRGQVRFSKVKVVVKGRRATLKARINVSATVKVTVRRMNGRRPGKPRKLVRKGKAGANSFLLGKKMKRGRYVVRIRGVKPGTAASKTLSRKFRVRRR